ncbi:MAG: Flp pilus assembly complex ATPase component TadA [bacterium]|nr:Flp pilus assembly complex ATPase component TadA [bacterium]MCM1373884.1 Flp pilus assembly complex ATPase component TadA [Muribaculum sp.]
MTEILGDQLGTAAKALADTPQLELTGLLDRLVDDYSTKKQPLLIQMKKGLISRESFLEEAGRYAQSSYGISPEQVEELTTLFGQYIFGYSRISPLIDDREISDIRIVSHENIRVKKQGRRMDAGISFLSEKEYRQFVDYVATKNQVNISNLNAIQRFTDSDSHPDYILRFTISMPLVNTYSEPYLCIRKVPRDFPEMRELIDRGMLDQELAELLISRFRSGSTLICGGNSSGKTTLLNALKETLPDDVAILVTQQADELTTKRHPDMMFLHSLPGSGESQVSYDLKNISIAGLTMDVDFFIIGEVKGDEALYLLNAAYTGQLCAATLHAPSADRAVDKLVDYAMYGSRYSRDELMQMMECFTTVVYMERYRVKQVFANRGWDRRSREMTYERLY